MESARRTSSCDCLFRVTYNWRTQGGFLSYRPLFCPQELVLTPGHQICMTTQILFQGPQQRENPTQTHSSCALSLGFYFAITLAGQLYMKSGMVGVCVCVC